MQTNFDEMLESILPELAALVDKRRKAEFLDKEIKGLQAFVGAKGGEKDVRHGCGEDRH